MVNNTDDKHDKIVSLQSDVKCMRCVFSLREMIALFTFLKGIASHDSHFLDCFIFYR